MNHELDNFSLRRTIIYTAEYLFHKTYLFGYVQGVKVIFKFDLSTV